jgi:hypothetical protein
VPVRGAVHLLPHPVACFGGGRKATPHFLPAISKARSQEDARRESVGSDLVLMQTFSNRVVEAQIHHQQGATEAPTTRRSKK